VVYRANEKVLVTEIVEVKRKKNTEVGETTSLILVNQRPPRSASKRGSEGEKEECQRQQQLLIISVFKVLRVVRGSPESSVFVRNRGKVMMERSGRGNQD